MSTSSPRPLGVATVQRWLSATLPEDEVSKAIQLPEEVLYSLYGNILRFGPAGEEVAKVLEAIDSMMGRGAPSLSSKLDSLRRVSSTRFLAPITKDGFNLSSWVFKNGDNSLVEKLRDPNMSNPIHSDYLLGVYVLCWMLNGQYIFPREAIDHSSPFVEEANSILRMLDFPPLAGSFYAKGTPKKSYSK